jgi:threonine synthase
VIKATSVSEESTAATMRQVYADTGYVIDPHCSVGKRAQAYTLSDDEAGLFLETAHPVKFDSVREILGTCGDVPTEVEELEMREAISIEMDVNYDDLRDLLLTKI